MAKGFLIPAVTLPPLLPGATSGDDHLDGTLGADLIIGLAGNDTIAAGDGGDLIYGYGGDDVIFGDAGDDRIWGGDGNDVLNGGSGNDIITTGVGFDEVYDGEGADVVVLTGQGIVHAAADSGGNTYVASSAGRDGSQTLAYGANHQMNINLVEGTVKRYLVSQGQFVFATDVDTVSGFNRFVIGESSNGVDFKGSSAGETLISLHAERHNIDMGGGDDVVKISGGIHDHQESYVYAGSGDDLVIGGNGMWDRIFGEEGNDRIFGSARGEVLNNYLSGDFLSGGAGDDVITGGNAPGWLTGDAGNDILRGQDASEELTGGEGRDRISGGGNNDQFSFYAVSDSGPADFDTILDFNSSQGDKFDLRGIDAIAPTAGDDAFTFVGGAAFTGAAGELRLDARNGYAMLEADITGDGVADFVVRLMGVSSLSLVDFMLPGDRSGL
jgi:Ca2+-binding RTX toxin-like protein